MADRDLLVEHREPLAPETSLTSQMHGQRCREVPESTSQAEGKESRIYTCFAGGPGVPAFDPIAMALLRKGRHLSSACLHPSLSSLHSLTLKGTEWDL